MFIVRAAIWLGVISLFVPQGFAGENIELPFNTETVQIDAGEWCEGRTVKKTLERQIRQPTWQSDSSNLEQF